MVGHGRPWSTMVGHGHRNSECHALRQTDDSLSSFYLVAWFDGRPRSTMVDRGRPRMFLFSLQDTRTQHMLVTYGVLVPKGTSTPKSAYDALPGNCSFEQTSMCSTTISFVGHLES